MTTHTSRIAAVDHTLRFHIVGAGGNGSIMLTHLCRIHQAWTKLGGEPFNITIHDNDKVSEANLARQCFWAGDVGYYKAAVLAQRAQAFFGINVGWSHRRVHEPIHPADMVITCTDTARSRLSYHKAMTRKFMGSRHHYWLDLGNGADSGQVILGGHKLPTVVDVLPEIAEVKDDDAPSCSMAEALAKQDLFINSTIATFGAQLIWQLLRRGSITHHGYFVNLASGRVSPLPVPA